MSAAGLADARRVLARCDELAAVTADPPRLTRLSLTPEHARANALAGRWLAEAGLSTWIDAAGSRCGRLEGVRPGLPAVLLGSHLDTVPDAGRYDGILGVVVAIEVVRRLAASGRPLPFAVEVAAFGDEEGTRFGAALLGSRALAGTWDETWWELCDGDGVTLAAAFEAFGLDPARIATAARAPGDLVAYLEAHIEQGPSLEAAGRALGVVGSIAGALRIAVTATGRAGHAGGTAYEHRRDALVAASEVVVAAERLARETGGIATVGRLSVWPGAVNVIPGRVAFSLDLRAAADAVRDRLWSAIEACMAEVGERRGVTFATTLLHAAPAVHCSDRLRAAVAAGIRGTGDAEPMVLFSGAGHDAMALAAVTEVAMLFIRCHDGISHQPAESVRLEDVAAAVDALEAAVLALA
ncbi:allantoate amidohydrolase [Jiangella endophytica]|uniref:allantoate amidohydrolase n=1 Tax=Jiangella endophytica TaxID=1623398 RepID=UPI000E345015|nr:allantoate amidohydrolase [Jiangella endophytica]